MKARIIYDPNTSFLIKNPNLEKSRLALKTELFTRESTPRLPQPLQLLQPLQPSQPSQPSQPLHLVHDINVQLYRSNMTNKCPTEIKLAQVNQTRFEYGSIEWYDIKRSCFNADCCAKYHWCATCLLAPRCDCFMPHMTSAIGQDMRVVWSPDQFYYSFSLGRLTCDNRYGTFVQSVRSVAENLNTVSSPFCAECTESLHDYSLEIVRVSGRTYLEQASNLWKIISSIMCDYCVNIIDGFPCMHLGTNCPSTHLKLICTRLKNYQPRQTIDKSKTHLWRCQKVREPILSDDPRPYDVTTETCTSSKQIVASRGFPMALSIREAIRFSKQMDTSSLPSKKSDTGFPHTPHTPHTPRPQTSSSDPYFTTETRASNPPRASDDTKNMRTEAWLHAWPSLNNSAPA